MMDKFMAILSRFLYPNERAVEPGTFEAFLSPPINPDSIPERFNGRRR